MKVPVYSSIFILLISAFQLPVEGQRGCARPRIDNGRAKVRARGKMVYYRCKKKFSRVGAKFAVCLSKGVWSQPPPICIGKGCPRIEASNSLQIKPEYSGAMLKFTCPAGMKREGPELIYCDGKKWNVDPPKCVVGISLQCDFERKELCGWSQSDQDHFEWTWFSGSTPTVNTGPLHDHTFGEGTAGHYLFIESSAPRKPNDRAILESPLYQSQYSETCFEFWYHMQGPDDENAVGSLEVLIKPENTELDDLDPEFYVEGNQGEDWKKGAIFIEKQTEVFQVIIIATRKDAFVSDIALDDVRMYNCSEDDLAVNTTIEMETSTVPSSVQTTVVSLSSTKPPSKTAATTSRKTTTPRSTTRKVTTTKATVPPTKITRLPRTTTPRTPRTTTRTTTTLPPTTTTKATTTTATTTPMTTTTKKTTTRSTPPTTTPTSTVSTTKRKPKTTTRIRRPTTKSTTSKRRSTTTSSYFNAISSSRQSIITTGKAGTKTKVTIVLTPSVQTNSSNTTEFSNKEFTVTSPSYMPVNTTEDIGSGDEGGVTEVDNNNKVNQSDSSPLDQGTRQASVNDKDYTHLIPLIVGVSCGVAVGLIVASIAAYIWAKKKQDKATDEAIEEMAPIACAEGGYYHPS